MIVATFAWVQNYMVMKNLLTILIGAVVIALGAFFVLRNDDKPAEVDEEAIVEKPKSVNPPESVQPFNPEGTNGGAVAESTAGQEVAEESDEERRERERDERRAQFREDRMKQVKDRLDQRFALKISKMTRELNLTEEQQAAVQAFYDAQVETLIGADPRAFFTNPDQIPALASALRGDQLGTELADVLSPTQLQGLEEMEAKEIKNAAESSALTNLAKLQTDLGLSEDQKDSVYAVLAEQAESRAENQSDGDYLMRNFMKGMGMGNMAGDFDLGDVMSTAAAAREEGADREQIVAEMEASNQAQIDNKVNALSGVLDETQMKAYRGSLERQTNMMRMMSSGMGRGRGGPRGGGGR